MSPLSSARKDEAKATLECHYLHHFENFLNKISLVMKGGSKGNTTGSLPGKPENVK